MPAAKRVLLVEDEQIILADLARTLIRQGFAVAGSATSGPEAIEAAALLQPDLILMDIRLNGPMDGLEAAHRIRESTAVPIIFLTANITAIEATNLPEPVATISKPFHAELLQRTLARLFPPGAEP